MKKTFINNSLFRNLARHDYRNDQDTDSTYRHHNFDADDEIAEFYLGDDFGEKLDPSKESSIFVNRLLDRFMWYYDVDCDEISFTGNRNSINHFLSGMMENYMRYRILKYYQDEHDDFLS